MCQQAAEVLTDWQAGWDANPPGLVVRADALLPHVQQGVCVEGEGADVVE